MKNNRFVITFLALIIACSFPGFKENVFAIEAVKADVISGDESPSRKLHRSLILQEAARRNIIVAEQEIDQAVAALRRGFPDIRSLGAWMQEQGLDDKSLFDVIREEMTASRVRAALVEGVMVSAEEVELYFEEHKDEFKTAGDVRLRIIAVKNRAEADDILSALRNGESFIKMARKRSVGLRAAQGGDTGWILQRTLPPPLLEAVNAMKTGEIGGPLQRGEEFLIIGLSGRQPERPETLTEARPRIERRLLIAKQEEAIKAWLMEEERKLKIEVVSQAVSEDK